MALKSSGFVLPYGRCKRQRTYVYLLAAVAVAASLSCWVIGPYIEDRIHAWRAARRYRHTIAQCFSYDYPFGEMVFSNDPRTIRASDRSTSQHMSVPEPWPHVLVAAEPWKRLRGVVAATAFLGRRTGTDGRQWLVAVEVSPSALMAPNRRITVNLVLFDFNCPSTSGAFRDAFLADVRLPPDMPVLVEYGRADSNNDRCFEFSIKCGDERRRFQVTLRDHGITVRDGLDTTSDLPIIWAPSASELKSINQ